MYLLENRQKARDLLASIPESALRMPQKAATPLGVGRVFFRARVQRRLSAESG
jgi:hypothetical protein